MTKYFLRLILLVAAIIGVLLLIEAMLPRGYDFERSTSIDRSPEIVFGQLNSLKNWPNWSKQFNVREIEQLQIKYSGTEAGVGAAQTWTERRGTGKLWITESVANDKIVYESEFASFPKMTGTFTLTSDGDNQTKIKWRHHGRLPQTPLYGLLSGVFSSQMGYEYEKSLAALKSLLETEN
jgi:hypothetical protein